ncbi:MAG: ABC transporter permease subunit [Bacteroidota bacterium]
MFSILFEKELKSIFLSPKFFATFGVCSLLILLSVFVGIQEYNNEQEQYETALRLAEQQIMQEDSWWGIDNVVFRQPQPMQIFVSGVNNDIGRSAEINTWVEPKLERSNYADDTLFAVFRFIDLTFIVQVVLSLFAILFTYNSINGERESGTLKLALSNAVPRAQYVLAKFAGSWIGLTIPLMIPILLGVLLVMVLGIPMDSGDWARLGTLVGSSVLYFTFFIAFGLFVSSITKRSSVSFLILLVAWVALVLIVPRAATMAAGQIVPVTSVAEIESQKDRFRTDRWNAYRVIRRDMREEREAAMSGMTREERDQYQQANQQSWQTEERTARDTLEDEINEFSRKVDEELRNQKTTQERMAFTLSRFSPASAYKLTAMQMANTGTELKSEYEDAMKAYRTSFSQFVEAKREEERKKNAGQGGFGRNRNQEQEPLDLAELPRFEAPAQEYAEAIAPSIIDFGLLSLFSIAAFGGAFVSFIRYDVR